MPRMRLATRSLSINCMVVLLILAWCIVMCRGGFVTDFSGARPPQYTPIYNKSLNAWTFADQYELSTSPTFLFAQVCAEQATCAAESLSPGGCNELQALVDEAGWTNAINTHTVCDIQYPSSVSTSIRVLDSIRLVVANNESLLQPFDTKETESAVTLRLRLMYVTVVDADTVRVRTRRMHVTLPMIQEMHAVVRLVARCTVLELTSPRPSVSALSGGSFMLMRKMFDEDHCVWQCGHKYYKLPFNAASYSNGGTATGSCEAMPAQFVAIRASFKLSYALPSEEKAAWQTTADNHRQFLDKLDRAANNALLDLQTHDAEVIAVLFSLRGSDLNTLSFQVLMDKYALEPDMEYQVLHTNLVTGPGRRLLDADNTETIDVLTITKSVDMQAEKFSKSLLSVVQALNFSEDLPVDAVAVDVAIESAHQFRRAATVGPPAVPGPGSTPVAAGPALVSTTDPATITLAIAAWFVGVASCAGCMFFTVNMLFPKVQFARTLFSFKRRRDQLN